MQSSSETALATTSDAAITLIAANNELIHNLIVVINDTQAGFLSTDGGKTWGYVPAATTAPATVYLSDIRIENKAIMFKRVAGGTNVTGLFAWGV